MIEIKIVQVTEFSKAREYVALYKNMHPDKAEFSYNTVYSLHLEFKKSDGSDLAILLSSHLGQYEFKLLIQKRKPEVHSGIRIYHAAREKDSKIELFNYAVFSKTDKDGFYDDIDSIYEIQNHFFDLRKFSTKKELEPILIGHTTCNPVCYSGSNHYLG